MFSTTYSRHLSSHASIKKPQNPFSICRSREAPSAFAPPRNRFSTREQLSTFSFYLISIFVFSHSRFLSSSPTPSHSRSFSSSEKRNLHRQCRSCDLFLNAFSFDPSLRSAAIADLCAAREPDPTRVSVRMLHF
ncbi:hypothetical protein ACSQ67_021026 [Phaseolus vulgaris]